MSDRLTRLRTELDQRQLDGLFVSGAVDDMFHKHSQNRHYLTGFRGSWGHALVTQQRAILAVDSRYTEQAEREATGRGFSIFRTEGRFKNWLPGFLSEAGLAGRRLGLSSGDMSLEQHSRMAEALDDMPAADRPRLEPVQGLVEKLRVRKDSEEIALLQRAIDIGDATCDAVIASLRPGMTETEVAAAVARGVVERGAEAVSFPTIVAGGPWSAMAHASPRPEAIAGGEPVVIDMGAIYEDYCSDLTRSATAGVPSGRFREIYEIVFEAQRAAIEKVESGMTGVQAHALAADVIQAAGYGDNFGHGLGHGVGLAVHEGPSLSPYSEDTLEDGMVFTIEPGIYIPGWGGVRIEDVVVLEGGRARVMSHAHKLTPAGV